MTKSSRRGSAVAIVLAGGSGSRSGRPFNKVYQTVRDVPLLSYSLMAFEAAPGISDVIVVARNGEQTVARGAIESAGSTKVRHIVGGGSDRHGSEMAGLDALARLASLPTVVAIHDGARPFVTADLIERLLDAALASGGALPGVAIDEPVLSVAAVGGGRLLRHPLVRVQTPQVFLTPLLVDAYEKATRDGFSGVDTAETVSRYSSTPVVVVAADPRNMKVTFPADFARAHTLAADWRPARWNKAS